VVNSQTEKDAIELKAKSASGVSSVDNQLEVKPN
jgi:osmotically-inducible protein OsmY